MLQPLSSPPPYLTPEQHDEITSSTPSAFTAEHLRPPILRWYQAEGVGCEVIPSEGFFDGRKSGGLWVTEEAVSFLHPESPGSSSNQGWTLAYTSLTLHALTPASGDFPAHLYLQVDESDAPSAQSQAVAGAGEDEEDEDEGGEDEYTPMREIQIFVDESKLQELFTALSRCSALHAPPAGTESAFGFFPSHDDIDDDEEDDTEGAWEDADEDDTSHGVNGHGEDEGGGAGRVRSDFMSGGGPGARFRPY